MIISDNPSLAPSPRTDQYWQITDRMSLGGAGGCGGGEAGRALVISPLPGRHTQINKLSESHINLNTSEASEAMCPLSVSHLPHLLLLTLILTFAKCEPSHQ